MLGMGPVGADQRFGEIGECQRATLLGVVPGEEAAYRTGVAAGGGHALRRQSLGPGLDKRIVDIGV